MKKEEWKKELRAQAFYRFMSPDSQAGMEMFCEILLDKEIQRAKKEGVEGVVAYVEEGCHRSIGNELSEGERYGNIKALLKRARNHIK